MVNAGFSHMTAEEKEKYGIFKLSHGTQRYLRYQRMENVTILWLGKRQLKRLIELEDKRSYKGRSGLSWTTDIYIKAARRNVRMANILSGGTVVKI